MKLLLLAFFLGLTSLFAQKTVPLMDLSGTADEIITIFDWHGRGMIVLRTNTPKQYQLAYFPGYNTYPAKPWKANIDKHVRTNLPLIPNDQAEKGILNRIWSYGFTPKHAFFVEHFQNALYVHIIDTIGTVKSSVITPVPNRPNLKTKVFATNQELIVVALLKETGLPEEAYSVNDNGEFKKLPDFPTEKAKLIAGKMQLDSVSIRPKLALHYHYVNPNSVQYIEQEIEKNSIKTVTLNLPPVKDGKYWTDQAVFIYPNPNYPYERYFYIPLLVSDDSYYAFFLMDTLSNIKKTNRIYLGVRNEGDCISWKNKITHSSCNLRFMKISNRPSPELTIDDYSQIIVADTGKVAFVGNGDTLYRSDCLSLKSYGGWPYWLENRIEINSHIVGFGSFGRRSEITIPLKEVISVGWGYYTKVTPNRKKIIDYSW